MHFIIYFIIYVILSIGCTSFAASSEPNGDPLELAKQPLLPTISGSVNAVSYTEPAAIREPTEAWINACLFPQRAQSTVGMVRMEYFGKGSGTVRAAVYFKLGWDFGERIEPDPLWAQVIVSTLYGAASYIPMAVLGSRISSRLFKKVVTPKPDEEKAIEIRDDCPCGEYFLKGSAVSMGVLSSPAMAYLTYQKLNPVVSWTWLLPAGTSIIVWTAIDYFSLETLYVKMRDTISTPFYRQFSPPNSREMLIVQIRDDLQNAYAFISSLSRTQVDTLISAISAEASPKEKFKLLTHPERAVIQDMEEVAVQEFSWGEEVVSFVGGFVGGNGLWIFYPLAEGAFKVIFKGVANAFGADVTDEDVEPAAQVVAYISTVGASAVTALATHSSVRKFYQAASWLKSKWSRTEAPTPVQYNMQRIAVAANSTVFAICNATMQYEVAVEFMDLSETKARLELAAAVIASFSMTFWALDEALLEHLKQNDPRTGLLMKIDKMRLMLPRMKDVYLQKISTFLRGTNEQI